MKKILISMKQEYIILKLDDKVIKPLKILFESNELNYECVDGNCEWTELNNPGLKWSVIL